MANELLIKFIHKKTTIMNVRNNTDLRNDLIEVYNNLRDGKIGQSKAKEMANVAGKIIASAKSQLEYNKWSKSGKTIDFYECQ